MDLDLFLSRRKMIESAAGAVFFTEWLKAAQSHSHPEQSELLKNYQLMFFSAEDFAALEAFTEILIPSDETPGARDAHCGHYIDFVVQASTDTPQVQSSWREAMAALKEVGFHDASAARRIELVSEMSQPEVLLDAKHPAYFAYRLIKRQTAFAFYTSREGLVKALDYKGNSYNPVFPACNHPEHQTV